MGRFDDLPREEFLSPPEEPSPPRARWPMVAIAAVALIAALVGVWWYRSRERAEPVALAPTVTEQEVSSDVELGAPAEAIELPALADSDEVIRRLVRELSSHPELGAWLVSDGLIRIFVATVENIAEGRTPTRHLRHVAPKDRFTVVERGDDLVVDPRSYARYDRHAAMVDSIDAQGAARLYTILKPLINEAYLELGRPDRSFDATLLRAIQHLLATPVTDGPTALLPYGITYQFADQTIETLSPAQKQLLRMGPTNARVVQAKLRAIAGGLRGKGVTR